MGAHMKSADPQLTFSVHFSSCFPSLFKIKMHEHQSTNKPSIKVNNWEGNKPPISAEQIRSEISLNMVNTSIRPVSHVGAASRDMSSLPKVSLGVNSMLECCRQCDPAFHQVGQHPAAALNDPKAQTGPPLNEHMPDPPQAA